MTAVSLDMSISHYSDELGRYLFIFLACSEAEKKFFLSHEVFHSCDPRVWGVEQLSKRLTALLVVRIQLQLSPMKTHVEKNLGDARIHHYSDYCHDVI